MSKPANLAKIELLRAACDDYLKHLKKRINKDYGDNLTDIQIKEKSTAPESAKSLVLSCKKYIAVKNLKDCLNPKMDLNQVQKPLDKRILANFCDAFNKNTFQNLIKERNDKPGITFLKVIATIFSAGLLAACGLWKVKGREFIGAVNKIDVTDTNTAPMYNNIEYQGL